ncbi:zinc finger C3H1 domain-containing protein isoform X2 [Gouania willdenowi]|uniref:Putative zinc-finger domain-containing protein n=1 Tax=Gouania willdenowi TaxID=441366 RepID=A0A8C5EDU4_GOUWI|nr:zinc finger C3H1 domain-containing protein isoform X2 [Gouania willdenowi]
MESYTSARPLPNDRELEDGEICDDETEVRAPPRRREARRPGRGFPPRVPLHGLSPDFHHLMPYSMGPHGPFPPGGPDRPPPPSEPPPGMGPHGELPSPRSNFWERSHRTLGRFRHRGLPNRGRGSWGWDRGRPAPNRYGHVENHGSPPRKQKPMVRIRSRKPMQAEVGGTESFEDLLFKYKQIQLELECIRQEESRALTPAAEPHATATDVRVPPVAAHTATGDKQASAHHVGDEQKVERKAFQAFNIKPLRQKLPTPAELDLLRSKGAELQGDNHTEVQDQESSCVCCEPVESSSEQSAQTVFGSGSKKVTTRSASRSKPSNQNTPGSDPTGPPSTKQTPGPGEQPITAADVTESGGMTPIVTFICRESSASSEDSATSTEKVGRRVEEDELSELQLRLLALQSASRKWQQKEQQVMKRSRDHMTKVTTRSVSSAGAAPERSRTRTKPPDQTRSKPAERTKTVRTGLRDVDKDRPSPKAAPRPPSDRGRALVSKKLSPGSLRPGLRKQMQKQQKEQEEKRRQEEEERRKREEEIRRIRDLSNHEEQYNRFMKLVGGHKRTHSQSRDSDHRKSLGKACLDTSGNLYQYDNYEEVAMDTDSETGSPVPSPTNNLQNPDEPERLAPVSLSNFPQLLLVSGPPPPPPPPLEELEPPPKPPFADEEEEEEMLLRETCLMSMATKRVEQQSLSAPSSPTRPSRDTPPPRGNLNTVNLNTQSQRSRFPRGLPTVRPTLVLPRHKAVVVSLKDSDSDSEGDSSSSQGVFGGLEFMIKEARRTAEASKPKAASGCEKENNPLRTAAVLPEQITREKPQMLKDVSSRPAVELAMNLNLRPVTEAEQRVIKYRQLLQKDEVVLKHLHMQELKKSESLRAAESKVAKLREQLQASEKIAMANRILLRKLQEQVRRVEQRVSLKKSVLVRLEQDLLQVQQTAGPGIRLQPGFKPLQPRKFQHSSTTSRSNRHLAELMAQKQRLQQLESEYALKIQQLKETQALRKRGVPPPLPAVEPPPPPVPPTPPQPSLHDLSQDKLTLGGEDIPDLEDTEPRPARRSSIRESTITKPLLDTASCTPSKDGESKVDRSEPGELVSETLGELDVDALRQRFSQQDGLEMLLLTELHRLGGYVDTPPAGQMVRLQVKTSASQLGCLEQKPVPLQPYHSPLLVFKSYRFSPYYRTKEKLSLSSVSFSNTVDVHRCFCRFDLTGTCNHTGCPWQHMRDITLRGVQLFEDLLSYSPSLLSCSSDKDVRTSTESYMKLLFGLNSDRMNLDQKAVLLVSKVNESRRHTPPYTTWKDRRKWRPRMPQKDIVLKEDSGDETMDRHVTAGKTEDISPASRLSPSDVFVTFEDRRYYPSETDDVSNLELSVQEHPEDIALRVKLAFKILDQGRSVDEALSVLARALEIKSSDGELWIHYLTLLSLRGSRAELMEMFEVAVQRAPLHRVWWKYLTSENSFEGQEHVSKRLLHFLCEKASSGVTEKVSFQLMEVVLFRVELHLFTGRRKEGNQLMEAFLRSSSPPGDFSLLVASHRALLWLSYIHLCEVGRLPSVLFDPAHSGPTHLVSTEHFLLPWTTPQDVTQPPDLLLALFSDALRDCTGDKMSDSEKTRACLPLYQNLLLLQKLLHRYEEALCVCEPLLQVCPELCVLRDAMCELLVLQGRTEQALSVWLIALAECPHNAEVFYRCCCFLMEQDKVSAVAPLLRGFVLSLCDDEQSHRTPVDVLRHILGLPTDELLQGPQLKEELLEPIKEQNTYLHLIHCRWQWMQGCVEAAVEAYERALSSVLKLEELHLLWMDYLQFAVSQPTLRHRKLSELIHGCLSTVPTRLQLPFKPAQFWTCYKFHNKVISFYLSRLPRSQHSLLLERLHCAMPNNTDLGLRILHADWLEGNLEHLRFHARLLSSSAPCCLPLWKILITVQKELKESVEVRLSYQQALQHLPLSADLWKHRLLFEVVVGGASERLRSLVGSCRQLGVAVDLVSVGLKADS